MRFYIGQKVESKYKSNKEEFIVIGFENSGTNLRLKAVNSTSRDIQRGDEIVRDKNDYKPIVDMSGTENLNEEEILLIKDNRLKKTIKDIEKKFRLDVLKWVYKIETDNCNYIGIDFIHNYDGDFHHEEVKRAIEKIWNGLRSL